MTTAKAVLAGGCFWGMQDLIRKRPGIVSTRVGYTGGDVPNATYRNHGTHAEAIEITYDPAVTSYRDLLEFFFQIHDPTTLNRQGGDIGLSYRSAIFYTDDEQKRVAQDTIADVEASGLWPGKVVTEVTAAGGPGQIEHPVRAGLVRLDDPVPGAQVARPEAETGGDALDRLAGPHHVVGGCRRGRRRGGGRRGRGEGRCDGQGEGAEQRGQTVHTPYYAPERPAKVAISENNSLIDGWAARPPAPPLTPVLLRYGS